jgi:hypothetical protein
MNLEQIAQRLSAIENHLYELSQKATDLKVIELWLTAQNQMRIALEAIAKQNKEFSVKDLFQCSRGVKTSEEWMLKCNDEGLSMGYFSRVKQKFLELGN